MPLPPVPESPSCKPPGCSLGTPRVGMHLYQNDSDDDVSVLTFNTLTARDNNSIYVRTVRENLEKMILQNENTSNDDDDDAHILTRISEEVASVASHNSSCNSKNEVKEEADGDSDEDTITIAESVIDSANKVLSNIGSWRGKEDSSSTHESPDPQPRQKHPSPTKRPTVVLIDVEDDRKGHASGNKYNIEKDDSSSTGSVNEKYDQVEVSSNFLNSYFRDENAKPSDNNTNKSKYTIKTNREDVRPLGIVSVPSPRQRPLITKGWNAENEQRLRSTVETNIIRVFNPENEQRLLKLEADTKHLSVVLKERQLETRKANQALLSSIAAAKKLLDRIGVGKDE